MAYTKQIIYQIVCPILSSQKERYLYVIFHLEASPHAILPFFLSLEVGVTGGLKFGSESSSTILSRSVFENPSKMISRHTQKGTTLILIKRNSHPRKQVRKTHHKHRSWRWAKTLNLQAQVRRTLEVELQTPRSFSADLFEDK